MQTHRQRQVQLNRIARRARTAPYYGEEADRRTFRWWGLHYNADDVVDDLAYNTDNPQWRWYQNWLDTPMDGMNPFSSNILGRNTLHNQSINWGRNLVRRAMHWLRRARRSLRRAAERERYRLADEEFRPGGPGYLRARTDFMVRAGQRRATRQYRPY